MSDPRPPVVLDPGSLEQIEMLERFKPGSRAQLATLFQSSFARDRDAARDALAGGDAVRARRAAHSIKGSAAGMGATALSQCAATMERVAGDGDLAATRAALEAVERAFDDAWAVLGGWIEPPAGDA